MRTYFIFGFRKRSENLLEQKYVVAKILKILQVYFCFNV